MIIWIARWRSDRVGVPARVRHSPRRPQGGGFPIYYTIDYNTERCCKVNILIDSQCHARLADFGLAAIDDELMSGTVDELMSSTVIDEFSGVHGTIRWMAPELLHPKFGFTGGFGKQLPTKDTDIYAIGMTILEASARACSSETPISHSDRL